MADVKPQRVPEKRNRGNQPTLTPQRLGGVASAILQGDTITASCHASGVSPATFQYWIQRGEANINEIRKTENIDDIEGAIWQWVTEGGGFGTANETQWYWTANPPQWWPKQPQHLWLYALFTIVISWARGKAEQIYRASITRAAQGDSRNGVQQDWRAAQFMLTHSFGWRSAERIELTGADGGAVKLETQEGRALEAIALLAEKQKTIDELEQNDGN